MNTPQNAARPRLAIGPTLAIVFVPLMAGVIAVDQQLPVSLANANSEQLDLGLNRVGAAYALTAVALILWDAAVRAMGPESLVAWFDLAALSVGAWTALFLGLGALEKHNVLSSFIDGFVGMGFVFVAGIIALVWKSRHP